jgi:putative two-component system response regulator
VGDQISAGVQAVSLADVYDALVNVRCYKEALSFDEARRMIFDGECGTFNPDVLDSMLAVEQTMRGIYKLGEGQSAEEDLAAEALLHEQTIMEDNN